MTRLPNSLRPWIIGRLIRFTGEVCLDKNIDAWWCFCRVNGFLRFFVTALLRENYSVIVSVSFRIVSKQASTSSLIVDVLDFMCRRKEPVEPCFDCRNPLRRTVGMSLEPEEPSGVIESFGLSSYTLRYWACNGLKPPRVIPKLLLPCNLVLMFRSPLIQVLIENLDGLPAAVFVTAPALSFLNGFME